MDNNRHEAFRWFHQSQRDLKAAHMSLKTGSYEWACFQSQQAAEKALKSVMISIRVSPPRTHNIGYLLDHLVSSGVQVPAQIFRSARLTDYAVSTRYPGSYESVTRDEYLEAYHLAEEVVEWAQGILSS